MSKYKIIISGGGTGGHVFPAIAIANALKETVQQVDILFVGAEGKMEMEKVPEAGYEIIGLPIMGLQRRLTPKNLKFPFKLMASMIKARKIVKKFKPDVVVGVGGYASGPMLKVAASKGIPTLIQEQNSYAGLTNKLLGKKVDRICVAYDGMDKFFPKEKIVLTGNPVRQDIKNLESKAVRGLDVFGLEKDKKTVLVMGGSLGARSINEAVHADIDKIADSNIQMIWQTGKAYYPNVENEVEKLKTKGIHVMPFIRQMDYAYAVSDLVVSRAGAISVSEISLAGKASILVPSPNVAEDHQTKNAMALVTHHAAILIKDKTAKAELVGKMLEILNREEELEKLRSNILNLAFDNAANTIASEVVNLIVKK